MSDRRQMTLGAFLMATGQHIAAWRHPDAPADAGVDIDHFIHLARIAEAAKFDLIFIEDAAGLREANVAIASQTSRSIGFEPISLLSAIAAQTSHIGLVATASTSYNEPLGLARAFSSLDHLSGGRAGWNLVTSASEIEAANFGARGLKPHADRYARAGEFASVVAGLWDRAGNSADVPFAHNGQHFSVSGAAALLPSPQGSPVMVQAGASDVGRDLAARTADVVFTAAQTFEEAKAFYDDVKARLATYGRSPDDLQIMPGVAPVVAATESEALEKFEALQELIPDDVGVALLSSYLSRDLSAFPLDGPLPDLAATEAMQSRQALVVDQARRDNLSIRQLARHFAGARGHWRVVGTPQHIADELEARFVGGAADGFNIMPSHFPGALDDFADLVVPELQKRGLFRRDYGGTTLRDHLGLKRKV